MVLRRQAVRAGIVVLFSISLWAQTEPKQTVGGPVAYSSSKMKSSLAALAAPGNQPAPDTTTIAAASPVNGSPIALQARAASKDVPSSREKKLWISLAATEHSAAAFDAWSTRDAIRRGAIELNPVMKPFASSAAAYPVLQLVPTGMDLLARRMMQSHNHIVRKLWWVPQTASTAVSLAAGFHNLSFRPASPARP